jgi:hypothetical protein
MKFNFVKALMDGIEGRVDNQKEENFTSKALCF